MMKTYAGFAEIRQNEIENEDYTILCRETGSDLAVLAPHGGGIEPGTEDIADGLAGGEYTFYAFKGLKKAGNRRLHLSSDRFDEPRGVSISQSAMTVVTVHGSKYKQETVHIGGRNQHLKHKILRALQTAGFDAVVSDIPGIRGVSLQNICNRCRSGEGVQLEISRGLREKMFDNLDHRAFRNKTIVFHQFVNTLKQVFSDILDYSPVGCRVALIF